LRIGRGDEAARYLDVRSYRLIVPDQAGFTIAFELRELVALDREVAPRAKFASPSCLWPKHGPNGRRAH
jgi:hypothetical protein